VEFDDDNVYRGDPVNYVIGRDEEKPAKMHAPLPPKPTQAEVAAGSLPRQAHRELVQFEYDLIGELKQRLAELEPVIAELPELEEAASRLAAL
jgi:hypothetical protein